MWDTQRLKVNLYKILFIPELSIRSTVLKENWDVKYTFSNPGKESLIHLSVSEVKNKATGCPAISPFAKSSKVYLHQDNPSNIFSVIKRHHSSKCVSVFCPHVKCTWTMNKSGGDQISNPGIGVKDSGSWHVGSGNQTRVFTKSTKCTLLLSYPSSLKTIILLNGVLRLEERPSH